MGQDAVERGVSMQHFRLLSLMQSQGIDEWAAEYPVYCAALRHQRLAGGPTSLK